MFLIYKYLLYLLGNIKFLRWLVLESHPTRAEVVLYFKLGWWLHRCSLIGLWKYRAIVGNLCYSGHIECIHIIIEITTKPNKLPSDSTDVAPVCFHALLTTSLMLLWPYILNVFTTVRTWHLAYSSVSSE